MNHDPYDYHGIGLVEFKRHGQNLVFGFSTGLVLVGNNYGNNLERFIDVYPCLDSGKYVLGIF